jgi:pimeloyl-ACP methyl ester carboxylesterase
MASPDPAQQYPDRVDHDGDEWYVRARADVPHRGTVRVDGVDVRFRFWGSGSPQHAPLVFVHGGAAHSGWWDHIGPLLAGGRRVAALDLSGNGDSGLREAYTLRSWAEEITAVASEVAPGARPVLIAHSMAGEAALYVASVFASRIAGLILVDPLPHDVTSAETHARTAGKFGMQKVHPTREAAVSRFRVMPEQRTLDYVFSHIAEHSVREVEGGWKWKHDPKIYAVTSGGAWDPAATSCPIAVIHPEYGLSDQSGGQVFGSRAVHIAQSIVIAGAAHHIMLDEPLALVACLRTLLSGPPWSDLKGG